ncbi:MAG: hypothetical protein ACTSYW_03765 [Candidatus Heimdallarchaeota archaeon]
MKGLYYYFKSRRRSLLKIVLASSLLFICSFSAFYLPQLVNPHKLGKYLSNFASQSIDIHEYSHISFPDFELVTEIEQSSLLFHLENFSFCVNQASLKAFGFTKPRNLGFIHSKLINISIGNKFTLKNLIGVNDLLFQEMMHYSSNSSIETGAILCSTNESDLLGYYDFNLRYGVTKKLLVNKLMPFSSLSYFPEFQTYYNFTNGIADHLIEKFFILPLSQLTEFYLGFNHYLHQYGFILFTQEQKDIIYWSTDSVEQIEIFKQELINNFEAINPQISVTFIDHNKAQRIATENQFTVNLAYSFIYCLQFVIWSLVFFLLIATIITYQNSVKDKEVKVLLSGQNWRDRLLVLGLETIIISVSSFIFGVGLFIPFMYLQRIVSITFNLLIDFPFLFLFLGIHSFVMFFIFLDYEFFLRKYELKDASENISYRLFITWPLYLKVLFSVVVLSLLIFISKLLTNFLFLSSFIGIALLTSAIVFGLFFFTAFLTQKISRAIRKRKNKPFSKTNVLWKLLERKTLKRFAVFLTLFSIMMGGYLFSNYSANVLRTKGEWYLRSSQIVTSIDPTVNSTLLELSLDNCSNIDYYQKSLFSLGSINDISSNRLIFDQGFTGNPEDEIFFLGENSSNVIRDYSTWRESMLLLNGKLKDFKENSLFITNALRIKLGCSIGDIIQVSNGTIEETFIVSGIINHWPGFWESAGSGWTNTINIAIMDYHKLMVFINNYSDFSINYYIHTPISKINSTVNYLRNILIELDTFEWIGFVDPVLYDGLWIIFTLPLILEFELLIAFLVVVIILSGLENKWFSDEARTLGILAMSGDHFKPYLRVKLFQFLSMLFGSLIVLLLMYLFTYLYYSYNTSIIVEPFYFLVKAVYPQIIGNMFLVFGLFNVFVVIALLLDLVRFRKLNLSVLYRYIE